MVGKSVIHIPSSLGLDYLDLYLMHQPYDVLEGFEIKGGVERDGILFVMEGEKAKEAESKIKEWLQKIKVI